MPDYAREAWITGVGIVSSLGEGADAHWSALEAGTVVVEAEKFAPYVVHPIAPLDFDRQIPKKGDQRQMEPWQRIGTYAAGLALEASGIKGNAEVLGRTDVIVAASGGERDLDVDIGLIRSLPRAANPGAMLNERLMSDLRPTLFLAQLSNLLAGNISIVHGVTGSSRTFMGEELAGVDAVRIALARIAAGQSDVALVGGASNGERLDMLLLYEFGGLALRAPFAPVWERRNRPGFAMGSMGAFLTIESRAHAEARGARPLARLSAVLADAGRRRPGRVGETLQRLRAELGPRLEPGRYGVISGATGVEPATSEERELLGADPQVPVRAPASRLGHGIEAHFPMNLALAGLAVSRGAFYRGDDASGVEAGAGSQLRQVLVTATGMSRGEGLALVEAVG